MELERFNLGVRPLRHSHVCKGCSAAFRSNRPDAVCCSARCRKRYQRICDKLTVASAAKPVSIGMGDTPRSSPTSSAPGRKKAKAVAVSVTSKALKKKGRPARSTNSKKGRKKK